MSKIKTVVFTLDADVLLGLAKNHADNMGMIFEGNDPSSFRFSCRDGEYNLDSGINIEVTAYFSEEDE